MVTNVWEQIVYDREQEKRVGRQEGVEDHCEVNGLEGVLYRLLFFTAC